MAHFVTIGTNRIQLTDDQQALDIEGVKNALRSAYPEIANATGRERTLDDGTTTVIDFLPQPGRKG